MSVRKGVEQICYKTARPMRRLLSRPKKAQLRATRRRPDRDETEPGSRSGLELELIRPSPPRGRDTCGLPHNSHASRNTEPDDSREAAPHSSEFRHYTSYPENPEATWAQPLSREELS